MDVYASSLFWKFFRSLLPGMAGVSGCLHLHGFDFGEREKIGLLQSGNFVQSVFEMIIEIEAYFGDCYLWGKGSTFSEIKKQMNHILSEVSETDFADVFCARFGYEKIIPADKFVDVVIDLDTHKIYRRYNMDG